MPTFWVYLLQCSDGSYYAGHTEDLEVRLAQHRNRTLPVAYTHDRLPVDLVWFDQFPTRDEAFARERQIKGWSRKKKQALIDGDWSRVKQHALASRRDGRPSTAPLRGSAQGGR